MVSSERKTFTDRALYFLNTEKIWEKRAAENVVVEYWAPLLKKGGKESRRNIRVFLIYEEIKEYLSYMYVQYMKFAASFL